MMFQSIFCTNELLVQKYKRNKLFENLRQSILNLAEYDLQFGTPSRKICDVDVGEQFSLYSVDAYYWWIAEMT